MVPLEEPHILPQLRYERPEEAIEWLCRAFGFSEESRMTSSDGRLLIAALRSSLGGRVMIGGMGAGPYRAEVEAAVPDFRQPEVSAWPNLSYSITVMVNDVDVAPVRLAPLAASV